MKIKEIKGYEKVEKEEVERRENYNDKDEEEEKLSNKLERSGSDEFDEEKPSKKTDNDASIRRKYARIKDIRY